MEILGLQGSPRKNGNSDHLLSAFLKLARSRGARTTTLDVARMQIKPCMELTVCEKKGTCPIRDEMAEQVYGRLRRAEIVVVSSPVFFYNVPAQLKALIDRSQTLWARKYRLGLKDPKSGRRLGFLLAVGATSGARLFEGMELTLRYFFDAVDAKPAGSLTYKGVEGKGRIKELPSLTEDLEQAVSGVCGPFQKRQKVLFLGRKNSGASRMAAAFMQAAAGDRLDVVSAGLAPAPAVSPETVRVMAEEGLDLAFQLPRSPDELGAGFRPDYLVVTGAAAAGRIPDAGTRIDWQFDDQLPADKLRDEMRTKVDQLLARILT